MRGRSTSRDNLHIIVNPQLVGRRLCQNASQILRDVTASQAIRSTRNDHTQKSVSIIWMTDEFSFDVCVSQLLLRMGAEFVGSHQVNFIEHTRIISVTVAVEILVGFRVT